MATDAEPPPPRVELELPYLHECCNAVLLRRVERGRVSIRTRTGYELLRSKYQPRVRFLHDADAPQSGGADAPGSALAGADAAQSSTATLQELSALSAATASHSGDDSDAGDRSDGDERAELERVVGVYFDPRIKRFITDVCWPLAHFGGAQHELASGALAPSVRKPIPEWQELARNKYFVFTFQVLLWLFPGLPGFEAQDQAERDWQRDCDFDAYGRDGLSFEGFVISLLDLATACTTGSVDACLEFLQLMVQRLQTTLPPFRDPARHALADGEAEPHPGEQLDAIAWRTVPLERLTPCPLRPKAQYYELKAKLSTQPLVLMVLLGNEKPAELQLSTSAKLLIRERDSRTSVRRQTIALKAHFVELEKQFLWTFRSLGDRPSLLVIPNHCISRRTLTLYACLRLIDGREQELQRAASGEPEDPETPRLADAAPPLAPILTLLSSIQDPFPLVYGAANSLCGRIDRQTTRLFAIDHRTRTSPFAITLTTSLIQNTASGGGTGAAAVLAALTPPSSPLLQHNGSGSASDGATVHSFVFVVKYHDDAAVRPSARVQRLDATLPQQWHTTLSGTNETKTIVIDDPIWIRTNDAAASDTGEEDALPSAAGLYYLYIFSLHGFYFELQYDDIEDPEQRESSSDSASSRSQDAAGDSAAPKRQQALAAEPPPELLEGSKVTHVKTASAAETLKSKFLRARTMERQLRLAQFADDAHAKGIATLERSMKKRALFASTSGSGQELEAPVRSADSEVESADASAHAATVDAHVALLTEFFKDMAAFQPSQQDVLEEQAHRAVAEKREGALLEHFAEFFESDTALQNLVDEEKWLSSDAKAARRATRRSSRYPPAPAATAQTHASVGDAVPSPLTSEDYTNTAQYIEALMRDVAEYEQTERAGAAHDRRPLGLDASAVDQQVASWKLAQLRSARTEACAARERAKTAAATAAALEVVEQQRRSEWMQSSYVQRLGAAELAVQQELNPLRSPLILTRHSFQDQEATMPWQAVWQDPLVSQSGGAVGSDLTRQHCYSRPALDSTAAPRDEGVESELQTRKSPHRTPVRPATAASRSDAPREVTTAAQSAAFAYTHSRRIYSAQTRGQRPSPRVAVHSARSPRSAPMFVQRYAGSGAQTHHDPVVRDASERVRATKEDSPQCSEDNDESHWGCEQPARGAAHATPAVDAAQEEETRRASASPIATAKAPKARARRRKAKQTDAAKRFARQVQELLAISAAVKAHDRVSVASVVT